MPELAETTFRFDAVDHRYLDLATGEELPHITEMLERTGWVDSTWYTEESSARGTAVHELTAAYDLGAIDLPSCVSPYRGYLLAHATAMGILHPTWLAIEEPVVHQTWHFGGRPDREVVVWGLRAVLEGKSGSPMKSHPIQTALQAILVAPGAQLPPTQIARLCLYWKADGKFRLEQHRDQRDFDEAYRILKACCT